MKKILFIVTAFYPENAIGSIRYSKLVKYLVELGFEVTVISPFKEDMIEDQTLLFDGYGQINHIRIPYGLLIKKFNRSLLSKSRETKAKIEKLENGKASLKKKLANLAQATYTICKNYSWYNAIMKSSQSKELFREINFDIMITGHPSISSHFAGKKIKQLSSEVFWIADYRDPVLNGYTPKIINRWSKNFARRITKQADIITAVSQGCLDSLYYDEHPKKVVLANGFDSDDIKDITYQINERFTLSYLGSLYAGRRDLAPIFSVFRELIDEKKIDPEKIIICYAGPSKTEFLSHAVKFQLCDAVEATDSISRVESLKKQLESHLLLLATWNNIGEEGVVTGKFLEYMMMDRPIVALVAGNLKNSVVKNMMYEGNLGVCYEEANNDTNHAVLKEYILDQYNCYIQNKPLNFHPNQTYVEKFDYKRITQELITLFPQQKAIQ